jgi:hypothetical protein
MKFSAPLILLASVAAYAGTPAPDTMKVGKVEAGAMLTNLPFLKFPPPKPGETPPTVFQFSFRMGGAIGNADAIPESGRFENPADRRAFPGNMTCTIYAERPMTPTGGEFTTKPSIAARKVTYSDGKSILVHQAQISFSTYYPDKTSTSNSLLCMKVGGDRITVAEIKRTLGGRAGIELSSEQARSIPALQGLNKALQGAGLPAPTGRFGGPMGPAVADDAPQSPADRSAPRPGKPEIVDEETEGDFVGGRSPAR